MDTGMPFTLRDCHVSVLALAISVCTACDQSAPSGPTTNSVNWDLSGDNRIANIGWPEGSVETAYFIEGDTRAAIRFPAGFSVDERVTLIVCRRDEMTSDRIDSIDLHLPKCTTDRAHQVARTYIVQWKLQKHFSVEGALSALDNWRSVAEGPNSETFLAARHDNYPIIDLEIRHSFDDSEPWFIRIYFSVRKAPLSADCVACFAAIRAGDDARAMSLIDGGLDPNCRDTLDNTLLHQAAEFGRLRVVKRLIDNGALVDEPGFAGHTPLWSALLGGHLDVAQEILDRGAVIGSRSHNGGSILHYVCEYRTDPVQNYKLAQWLVERGAGVNEKDNLGDTPLHKSAWKGHLDAARILIAAKADVNALNQNGRTPLDGAVDQRQSEMETLLRQHGAKSGVQRGQ